MRVLVVLMFIVFVFSLFFGFTAVYSSPLIDKTHTLTEQELNELMNRRIAQAMVRERVTVDQMILNGDNWHIAVFNNVEYTIYTGPGQVMATRWVELPETRELPEIQDPN